MRFRRRIRDRNGANSIDVTPLMDAAFILIIFLLISTAFKKKDHAFQLELPKATEKELVVQATSHTIFITTEGETFYSSQSAQADDGDTLGKSALSLQEIVNQLRPILESEPNAAVNLVADKGTRYNHIVRVIDGLRQAGVSNLQLPYEPDSKTPPIRK